MKNKDNRLFMGSDLKTYVRIYRTVKPIQIAKRREEFTHNGQSTFKYASTTFMDNANTKTLSVDIII